MSQAKDASAAGRGQIRLPDDNESINLEAIALQKTRYGPAFFRRTGMILAYIAFCAGAFFVVGHYKSSGVGGHLPPVRDLRIARPPARLHSEELVYDDDPMSAVFANSDNCNTTEAERWEFVDAGCGHGFTRGKERFSNSATKRFMLPVGEEQDIRLSARGNAHVSGVAHIVLAEDVEQKDVQVDVTFYMHDRKMFEEVMKVCRPTGPLALLGEQLSIQTNFPRWAVKEPSHSMFMDMTVRLPRGAASSPMRIRGLMLSVTSGDVKIIVDDLTHGVLLDTIELVTEKANITVDSVTTGKASVHANGGAIRGSFNVSGDLIMSTTDAPIDVNATLTASPASGSRPRPLFDILLSQNSTHTHNATGSSESGSQTWSFFELFPQRNGDNSTRASNKLNLKTTNGAITANVGLSVDQNNTPYLDLVNEHYMAEIRTTNAPIDVAFSRLPDKRQLKAGIVTQFANAAVSLPPNFSGPVCAQGHNATLAVPVVHDSMHSGLTAEERGVQFITQRGDSDGDMSSCAEVERMPSYARMVVPHGVVDIHV